MKIELNEQEINLIIFGLDTLNNSDDKHFNRRVSELKMKLEIKIRCKK